MLAWAVVEGQVRTTLLADRHNAAALDFYRRLGFAPVAMQVLRVSQRTGLS